MIYFDSDVLINYLVVQDEAKHELATNLYKQAAQNQSFFISMLSLQEVSFVLSKLKLSSEIITQKLDVFLQTDPVGYDLSSFKRACYLAEMIGYQNINDCLHTAIAEVYCDELYTFNQSDFKLLQKVTRLNITLLK
ncbi:type II toxin-antitoxin system VapC family toxin [Dyadobacter sp. CY107]|uniref:type II toxin-antitoxin system VapC family toxin n=1 Tax=Dyadobacter fanqingshengii TaxID=2906443 RepID=UPI001F3CA9FB|nr:type II toxin-antitoxin system VapC family toxin [Dyadobacter fanqingshengii]MCF2502237.1 type II toxin-antitoxin system VapC family toxin [Dyadobacter fanqingshengii]